MEAIIKEIKDIKEKEAIARSILNDLPEWFGLENSTKAYIKDSRDKPFLAAFYGGEPIGFIVLNQTSPYCADIFVMGVLKKFHHRGVGKKLICSYEALAKDLGFSFSQVKTVETGHYEEYDLTNSFYQAMGYRQLEVFPDLWDEHNPCQIYVKYLDS